MKLYVTNRIGANEEGAAFPVEGECDLFVSGLTEGEVHLMILFPGEDEYILAPTGVFIEDVMKTYYVAEHGVQCKLVGVGNNAGVFTRLARPTRRA